MATAKETLPKLLEIDGCLGACIVDSNSGMMLGAVGGGNVNLEIAAAGNTEVVRAKRKTMKALNLNEQIEDILISLGKQYHLIRPLTSNDALFVYVVLDRSRANLAMARHLLTGLEKELTI
jgi:predicted regulator of Ras-like GTPase activity (Roadblock/LC7/MglB family)